MDKRELANKIRALEVLSNDEKSALLALLNTQKKYGLVWEDKPENVELQMINKLPVLTEVGERAIISEDADAPNHILIEGDNLHALTALTYTHAGKIDVIYIDPPYNTGNNDFIYNDSYVDKEDSYRHSKWLSFMAKRLEIAKQLLSDRGVIFISIDDNEVAQLKLLCDETFGENNFQGHIHWRRRHNQPNDKTKMIGLVAEHVLAYSRNAAFLKDFGVGKLPVTATFSNPDNDPRGPWASKPWKTGSDQGGSSYTIFSPKGDVFEEEWMGDENTYQQLLSDKRIYFPNNGHGLPRKKYYQSEREEEGQCACNWWPHEQFGHNQGANDLLTAIFGVKNKFSNPKPIELVSSLVKIANISKDNIILDFFAGSGTTLHAIMQLNADDGGHRQCILVTNNESNICEEVTYERNRRVIQGYTKPNGEAVEGLHSNTLRYYRTSFVPRTRTVANMRALTNAATDLLCIRNNVYKEIGGFGGKRIPSKIARYFDDGKTKMLVIYAEAYVSTFVNLLLNMEVDGKILVYVFSNSNYAYDDNFEEVADKVELCALPDAIYKAYKKALPSDKAVQEAEKTSVDETANANEEDAQ